MAPLRAVRVFRISGGASSGQVDVEGRPRLNFQIVANGHDAANGASRLALRLAVYHDEFNEFTSAKEKLR